jgi:hypothetical protein
MAANNSKSAEKIFTYSPTTIERASLSLICSPFNLPLFAGMSKQTVPMKAIALENGVKNGYTKRPLTELACDEALVWLVQVGVLRREVDGQGITDSFRLTPLGRQLVEKFQNEPWRNPTWRDRLYNTVVRWFRLPL